MNRGLGVGRSRYGNGMYLRSIQMTVPFTLGGADGSIRAIASEDCCWRMAQEQLEARRPRWWSIRDKRSWRADRRVLDAHRERIRQMARDYGLIVP